jgi:pyruvate formate lyase activating enzyme
MTEEGPFLTRLVLSGGEPLMQPEAVKAISTAARIAGLKVGIETCGYYPDRLSSILKEGLMDRVFLDIKAALKEDEYARATGIKGGAIRVQESLMCLMESGVPFEVRITAFPEMPTFSEVSEIAGVLKNLKKEIPGGRLEKVWIQQGQPSDGEFVAVRSEVLRELAGLMEEVATVCVREKPIMRWGPGV